MKTQLSDRCKVCSKGCKGFNFDCSVDATLEICLCKKKKIHKPPEKSFENDYILLHRLYVYPSLVYVYSQNIKKTLNINMKKKKNPKKPG